LDLSVPGGLGGKETLTELLKINPDVKAIVSSGYAYDSTVSDYEKLGFCGIITKPYKPDELKQVIERVIES